MTSYLPAVDGPNVNSKLYDNVYVSSSNSLTSAARVVTGQITKMSLPSKTFTSGVDVQVINFPTNRLLGHAQLILKVPASAVPPGSFLGEGWCTQAVQYYEYVFSDSERLRIDNPHLLIKNMADVESGEKKSLFYGLSDTKLTAGTVQAYYTSSMSLYLPFSNLSSSRVHPFPADCLPRPVQLTIALNPWTSVLQYSSADANTIRTAAGVANGAYADSYVMCKTMYLLDPSDSISEMVSIRGDSKYMYPYMYPQSFVASRLLDGLSPRGSGDPAHPEIEGTMTISLTRFLNANLQSIDIFLQRVTLGNVAGTPAGSVANTFLSNSVWNPNYFSQMINCRLAYANQTIWQSDDNSDIMMNLSEYPTSTSFDAEIYPYRQASNIGVGVTGLTGNKSKWLHIQLSQLNERFYSNLSQVGPTLNSNEVLFEFNVLPRVEQETYGGITQDLTIQPKYRLYAVYNYAAGVRVAKGAANLVFQPELAVLPAISGVSGTY